MKRAVIIHCWDGTPNYAWYPWVKKELETLGYKVQVPAFPHTANPKLKLWLPMLQSVIGIPDEELVLIGHSIGCATIMRYLETLKENQKVGKVIFVAGFTDNLIFEEIKNFFITPINYEKIKNSVKNGIVAIQSDDDPYVDYVKYSQLLKTYLNAKIVTKHAAKHMSGPVDNEETCLELPEVIEEVKT